MKDRYEELRVEYLNVCDGNNGESCGGDPSVGIFPCRFYGYDRGCLLKSEEYITAPGGLNRLAGEIHENAVAHGWWEEERGLPEILMLCVSDLEEALEEYRAGRPMLYCGSKSVECENMPALDILEIDGQEYETPCTLCSSQHKKPEGVAVELADCVIRILDYCYTRSSP